MRFLILLIMTLPLFSCVKVNLDDLSRFVTETKAKTYPVDDSVPTLKKIDALVFTQKETRNPFSEPQAEAIAPVENAPKSCPQPNLNRNKQALEMYSLDNLIMGGTLFVDQQIWGLVQVTNGQLYKVKSGDYLGLNNGKVLKITDNKIDLLELVADQDGCWQERITQITLRQSE